jgi:predicted DNA-binding transcriptional regulator AlpA
VELLVNNVARLHRKEVMLRYGITKSTFHRWAAAGRLPVPVRFGGPLYRVIDLEKAESAGQLPRPMSA